MYYYGGYSGYGCNQPYNYYPNYNQPYNSGYGASIILVLFILLVIVLGAKAFEGSHNTPCGGR